MNSDETFVAVGKAFLRKINLDNPIFGDGIEDDVSFLETFFHYGGLQSFASKIVEVLPYRRAIVFFFSFCVIILTLLCFGLRHGLFYSVAAVAVLILISRFFGYRRLDKDVSEELSIERESSEAEGKEVLFINGGDASMWSLVLVLLTSGARVTITYQSDEIIPHMRKWIESHAPSHLLDALRCIRFSGMTYDDAEKLTVALNTSKGLEKLDLVIFGPHLIEHLAWTGLMVDGWLDPLFSAQVAVPFFVFKNVRFLLDKGCWDESGCGKVVILSECQLLESFSFGNFRNYLWTRLEEIHLPRSMQTSATFRRAVCALGQTILVHWINQSVPNRGVALLMPPMSSFDENCSRNIRMMCSYITRYFFGFSQKSICAEIKKNLERRGTWDKAVQFVQPGSPSWFEKLFSECETIPRWVSSNILRSELVDLLESLQSQFSS